MKDNNLILSDFSSNVCMETETAALKKKGGCHSLDRLFMCAELGSGKGVRCPVLGVRNPLDKAEIELVADFKRSHEKGLEFRVFD